MADLCLRRCCWISEVADLCHFITLTKTKVHHEKQNVITAVIVTDTDGDGLLAIDFTGEVDDSEMVGED
ncbi:hypothetical protein R6Q59_021838 [Mikania micrantha]